MPRKRNWKVAFLAAKDQNDSLKAEVLCCYQVLATIAIDGHCKNVDKDFLADLAEAMLPYDSTDVLADIKNGEFAWWSTKARPLEDESG